jgi:hypothetical protein
MTICYCSCMQHFRSIPAQPTIHPTSRERVESCEFTNLPSFLKGRHQYQWSLSMASLSNIHAVRISQGGGIELRYRKFSKCLGDFRPSKALEWLQDPVYFKVFRVSETRHTITFFGGEDKNREQVRSARHMHKNSIDRCGILQISFQSVDIASCIIVSIPKCI